MPNNNESPEKTPSARPKKKVQAKGVKRNYSKVKEIQHDCFKLEVAEMAKNMSWIKKQPKYEYFGHCHTFHTFDSQGRKQEYSTPIGGHFHKMEFIEHPDGSIEAKCVSGPLHWKNVWNENTEKFERTAVPVNPRDKHEHDVTYVHSEKIVKRRVNMEASKLLSAQAQLTSVPKGTEVS